MGEHEQNILYNFQFAAHTESFNFWKFKPILYNPTNNTLETVNPINFPDSDYIPDRALVANFGEDFFPFCSELNTKLPGDQNKTVMIATSTELTNIERYGAFSFIQNPFDNYFIL